MSAVTSTGQATPSHPFPAAIQARDHTALVTTLAENVVLHSAVTRTTFNGRETVAELYGSVIAGGEGPPWASCSSSRRAR